MIKTTVDPNLIWSVLEQAKLMKSEFVLVPNMLLQKSVLTSVAGISYDSIVTLGYFHDLNNPPFYNLWSDKDNALSCIALEGKSINQFMQEHRAYYGETAEFRPFNIYSEKFFTGEYRGIGLSINESKDDEAEPCPRMPLFSHYAFLGKINSMLFAYENSSTVVQDIDLTNNEDFMFIANAKAGVGALMWVPEIGELKGKKATEYTMSLTGTLLNISKGDTIKCTIKDRITGRSGYNFIVRFDVSKPKKRCVLSYYMMMLKVGGLNCV